MNINATLLIELIVFSSFVEITRRKIWPPIIAVIEQRQKEQAEGLAEAKKGKKILEKAEQEHAKIVQHAKEKHRQIVASAEEASQQLIQEAKKEASLLKEQYLEQGKAALERQTYQAHKDLEAQTLGYIRTVLQKVLYDAPNQKQMDIMIQKAIGEVSSDQ